MRSIWKFFAGFMIASGFVLLYTVGLLAWGAYKVSETGTWEKLGLELQHLWQLAGLLLAAPFILIMGLFGLFPGQSVPMSLTMSWGFLFGGIGIAHMLERRGVVHSMSASWLLDVAGFTGVIFLPIAVWKALAALLDRGPIEPALFFGGVALSFLGLSRSERLRLDREKRSTRWMAVILFIGCFLGAIFVSVLWLADLWKNDFPSTSPAAVLLLFAGILGYIRDALSDF